MPRSLFAPQLLSSASVLSGLRKLTMAKAIGRMIIHHPSRLHERITNRRTHKFNPALEKILAHRVGFRRASGQTRPRRPAIDDWFFAHELPNIPIEPAEFFLRLQKGF